MEDHRILNVTWPSKRASFISGFFVSAFLTFAAWALYASPFSGINSAIYEISNNLFERISMPGLFVSDFLASRPEYNSPGRIALITSTNGLLGGFAGLIVGWYLRISAPSSLDKGAASERNPRPRKLDWSDVRVSILLGAMIGCSGSILVYGATRTFGGENLPTFISFILWWLISFPTRIMFEVFGGSWPGFSTIPNLQSGVAVIVVNGILVGLVGGLVVVLNHLKKRG